jgi:hypothetical protein
MSGNHHLGDHMKPVLAEIGAGAISPKIATHLQKVSKPAVLVGGGAVSPKVIKHVKQVIAPKVLVGGGAVARKVIKHLSK